MVPFMDTYCLLLLLAKRCETWNNSLTSSFDMYVCVGGGMGFGCVGGWMDGGRDGGRDGGWEGRIMGG